MNSGGSINYGSKLLNDVLHRKCLDLSTEKFPASSSSLGVLKQWPKSASMLRTPLRLVPEADVRDLSVKQIQWSDFLLYGTIIETWTCSWWKAGISPGAPYFSLIFFALRLWFSSEQQTTCYATLPFCPLMEAPLLSEPSIRACFKDSVGQPLSE